MGTSLVAVFSNPNSKQRRHVYVGIDYANKYNGTADLTLLPTKSSASSAVFSLGMIWETEAEQMTSITLNGTMVADAAKNPAGGQDDGDTGHNTGNWNSLLTQGSFGYDNNGNLVGLEGDDPSAEPAAGTSTNSRMSDELYKMPWTDSGSIKLESKAANTNAWLHSYVVVIDYVDHDHDGYTAGEGDCDDSDATVHPNAKELCDSKDNDCDSSTDEDFTNLGQACEKGLGECAAKGHFVCSSSHLSTVCDAVPGPASVEKCDSKDNDCDGKTDEGFANLGQSCSAGVGECLANGTYVCKTDGTDTECNATAGSPTTETCDSKDNDCDGSTDDGFNIGNSCSAGEGACAANGHMVCSNDHTTAVCDATPGSPTTESCDSIDNDCDGSTDEDFTNLGQSCTAGQGACQATGSYVCTADGKGTQCDATPGTGGKEECGNNVDEDCDGTLDNGCADTDGDGIIDAIEDQIGTDPKDADSDDDGVLDGDEPSYNQDSDGDGLINALDPDSDNDGLFDGTEMGKDCTNPATNASAGHCRADADTASTTDPLDADSDDGGVNDGSEDANLNGAVDSGEGNPAAGHGDDDANIVDTDGDGLSDGLESFLGSDPKNSDTDNDGIADGAEPNPSDDTDGDGLINVLDVDSDNDALLDGTELGTECKNPDTDTKVCKPDGDKGDTKTSALLKDTDHGGVSDGSEDVNLNGVVDNGENDPTATHGDDDKNATFADADGDGLSDALEATLGTDPNNADSDNDGVPDGQEANPSQDTDGDGKINVLDPDSDGDGLFDGTEMGFGCDGNGTDSSAGNCVADADKGATTTSPLLGDTDHGGVSDGVEDANHNGMIDSGEKDPNDKGDDKPCKADTDCGASDSGRVCDASHVCIDGCRGTGGNGCPTDEQCSSTDDTIGTCGPKADGGTGGSAGQAGSAGAGGEAGAAGEAGTGGSAVAGSGGSQQDSGVTEPEDSTGTMEGGGCACTVPNASTDGSTKGLLAGLGLLGLFTALRRRRQRK